MALRYNHSQMSQRFKSRDLGNQVVGNCRMMILSSKKWGLSSWFTQRAMCGGTVSCINIVVVSHRLVWRARITDCSNNEACCSLVTVHVTSPVEWNKCTAAFSVTTDLSACKFLQLDLLHPPTWILPIIYCEDISSPWSSMIPSHVYVTLKKA